MVHGNAIEGGDPVALDALANASDVDDGTVLAVTGLPDRSASGRYIRRRDAHFTLDPSNAAYQHLAAGAQTTVTVSYQVSDGITHDAGFSLMDDHGHQRGAGGDRHAAWRRYRGR